jgi:hypothetical protein
VGRCLVAVTALALSAAITACAAISGVGSFSKGDCSGGECDDGGAPDSSLEAATHQPNREAATGDDQGEVLATEPDGAGDDVEAAQGTLDASEAAADARADASTPDASDAASTDAGTDAALDAPAVDAGGGCGPLDTVLNCGACGVACTLTSASAATCNGTTCAYTCIANHSDCNYATAPDIDGCECATPSCCQSGCQTTHDTGTGQSFYDCNPTSTFSAVTAIEACTAYALSVGGTAANCSDGWSCSTNQPNQVCYGDTAGTTCQTFCWGYDRSQAGVLYTCACPLASAGSWD